MCADIEETLGRELREVAGGVQVPALPPLPQETSRESRLWPPLLAAAAVVLIVAGAVVVAGTGGGDRNPDPAPSPTKSTTVQIRRTAPTVPYVVGQALYVDGEQVPGTWWSVEAGEHGWIAQRTNNTWWRGRGAEPFEIEAQLDQPPVISPDGDYVGFIDPVEGTLTGFDTGFSGEGLGGVPITVRDDDGTLVSLRAVTDDGRVIAAGSETAVLWLPLVDNSVVDLTETAPGAVIKALTPAGLVVTDEAEQEFYLVELSDAGELARIGDLPAHGDLVMSPGGEWSAWIPLGTAGGEVTSVPTLEVGRLDGGQPATLAAPDGWGFSVGAYAWEDDEFLVSTVLRESDGAERMVRCSPVAVRCELIASE